VLHYDGGGFAGWQVQPDERTVQGELERRCAADECAGAVVAAGGRTAACTPPARSWACGAAKWTAAAARALNAVLPRRRLGGGLAEAPRTAFTRGTMRWLGGTSTGSGTAPYRARRLCGAGAGRWREPLDWTG
jgi:hypothetical protein